MFGCKRLCVDTGYFETYNLPHVKLVDVSKTPIERFTADGIEVDGIEYPLDAVVCATGFAAMTGSFDKIRITGRDGLTLAEKWRAGPRAYLGLASAGFPNLFMITGPGSPSVLASMIQAIEQHVDWLADCIGHMRDIGARRIEPLQADEDAWVEHVNEVSTVSLRSTCSSWYVGDQHSRPAAGVHALYRRLPGLCAEMQRGDEQRLRRLCARRARASATRRRRCASPNAGGCRSIST